MNKVILIAILTSLSALAEKPLEILPKERDVLVKEFPKGIKKSCIHLLKLYVFNSRIGDKGKVIFLKKQIEECSAK